MRKLYGNQTVIHERHRHRYEVNKSYVKQMEEKGLFFVGEDDKGERMEIIELQGVSFCVRASGRLMIQLPEFRPPFLRRDTVSPRVQVAPVDSVPTFPGSDLGRFWPVGRVPGPGGAHECPRWWKPQQDSPRQVPG